MLALVKAIKWLAILNEQISAKILIQSLLNQRNLTHFATRENKHQQIYSFSINTKRWEELINPSDEKQFNSDMFQNYKYINQAEIEYVIHSQ